MRKLFILGAAAMLAFGAVGTASAGSLNWQGSLLLELGDLPPLGASGQGVAGFNGTSNTLPAHLATLQLKASRGAIAHGTQMVPITDPSVSAQIASVRVVATMGSGTFKPISGAIQSTSVLTKNKLPLQGLAKVCLLSTACVFTLPVPLSTPMSKRGNGFAAIGYGGLIYGAGGTANAPIRISVEAAPWTVKPQTSIDEISTPMTPNGVHLFPVHSAKGFAHGTASGTTSTANVSGVVQLITPMQTRTNIPSGSNSKIALFGYLTVHFIPEPGMLLLLGSGVAGLVLLGRHRMRK